MPTRKEDRKLRAAFFKKTRQKQDFFIVEGERAFAELCRSGWKIIKVFAEPKMAKRVIPLLPPNQRLSPEEISAKELAKLALTETPPGILALVEKRTFDLEEIAAENRILILDNLRDPGNVGTLLRTARSLSWNGVVLLKGTAELFSPKVVRSSAGALFHLKTVIDAPSEKTLAYLKNKNFQLWAADSNSGISPEDCRGLPAHLPAASSELGQGQRIHQAPIALVIGGETTGISSEVLLKADQRIKIPLAPGADSLNAAVSGGILMYLFSGKM